jgi:hypothetical protein
MKKNLLFLCIAVLLSVYGLSQSLTLSNAGGPIVSNSTIVQPGTPDSSELITYLNVKNTGSSTLQVVCKKQEIKMLDSTESTICWAGGCYPSNVFVSPNAQAMAAGETNTEFVGHYTQIAFQHFKVGESIIRWTFFDKNNVNDSVSVTIKYTSYPAGIADQKNLQESSLQVYPNPASASTTCSYRLAIGAEGSLMIRDLLGSTVVSREIPAGTGKMTINTADMNNGVYFCTLLVNGQPGQTRKLIVKH